MFIWLQIYSRHADAARTQPQAVFPWTFLSKIAFPGFSTIKLTLFCLSFQRLFRSGGKSSKLMREFCILVSYHKSKIKHLLRWIHCHLMQKYYFLERDHFHEEIDNTLFRRQALLSNFVFFAPLPYPFW